MKYVLMFLALVGLVLGGTSAWAGSTGPGCGLGTQLFKGQSGLIPNLLAYTTNGTFSNTFAVTSGTSGCKADNVVLRDKEQEVFVAANLGALNQELAQGQGQHVTALAALMGCPMSVQSVFASLSQEKYEKLFSSADVQATVMLAALKSEMGQQPVLAASCTRIS